MDMPFHGTWPFDTGTAGVTTELANHRLNRQVISLIQEQRPKGGLPTGANSTAIGRVSTRMESNKGDGGTRGTDKRCGSETRDGWGREG